MSEKVHNVTFPTGLAAGSLIGASAAAMGAIAAVLYGIGRSDLLPTAGFCGAICTVIALLALGPIVLAARIGAVHIPTAWLGATTLRLLLMIAAGAGLVLAHVGDRGPVAGFMLVFYLVSLVVESIIVIRFTADRRHDWSDGTTRTEAASC